MDKTYRKWISELKNKVRSAQIKAAIAINKELILFYWDLGQMISEKLLESNWGDGVLKNVVNDLKDEFPKMGGLSERNLKYCRQFYQFYTSHLKRQQLVAQREGSEDKDVLLGQQAVAQLENTDNNFATACHPNSLGTQYFNFYKVGRCRHSIILHPANHRKSMEQGRAQGPN